MPFTSAVNYARAYKAVAIIAFLVIATSPVKADRVDFEVNDDGASVEHSQPRIAVIPGKGFAVVANEVKVLADGYVASVRLPKYRVAASDRLVDAVEQLFGKRVAFLQ